MIERINGLTELRLPGKEVWGQHGLFVHRFGYFGIRTSELQSQCKRGIWIESYTLENACMGHKVKATKTVTLLLC